MTMVVDAEGAWIEKRPAEEAWQETKDLCAKEPSACTLALMVAGNRLAHDLTQLKALQESWGKEVAEMMANNSPWVLAQMAHYWNARARLLKIEHRGMREALEEAQLAVTTLRATPALTHDLETGLTLIGDDIEKVLNKVEG